MSNFSISGFMDDDDSSSSEDRLYSSEEMSSSADESEMPNTGPLPDASFFTGKLYFLICHVSINHLPIVNYQTSIETCNENIYQTINGMQYWHYLN